MPKSSTRPNDAFAEVKLPDAIHEHARGERIVGLSQPLRQRQAAAGVIPLRMLFRIGEAEWMLRIVENGGDSGLHRGARATR